MPHSKEKKRELYHLNPEKYRRGRKKYYLENKKKEIESATNRYHKNKEKYLERIRLSNLQIKLEVLSHYGANGGLRCSWPGCTIDDIDMLSLDHINDDGAKHRKEMGHSGRIAGCSFYRILKKNNFPSGFQTLCQNHQWKKEILRRREK